MGRVVRGVERCVEFLKHHLEIDVVHGRFRLGAVDVAVADQTIHGVTHGHFLSFMPGRQIRRNVQRSLVKWAGVPVEGLAQKVRLGIRGVIRRPTIVHQNARVKEISSMHSGSGKIIPNGLEYLLVPLVCHRHLGLRTRNGQEDEKSEETLSTANRKQTFHGVVVQ